jgi:hypothetical protein
MKKSNSMELVSHFLSEILQFEKKLALVLMELYDEVDGIVDNNSSDDDNQKNDNNLSKQSSLSSLNDLIKILNKIGLKNNKKSNSNTNLSEAWKALVISDNILYLTQCNKI